MVRALARAGMDVARLNFSHGTHQEHGATIALVRRVASEMGRPIAVLQDLAGPKIRTGCLRGGKPVLLRAGARVILTEREVPGTSSRIHVNLPGLARQARPGDRILLADGLIELRVEQARRTELLCVVVNGGPLGEHQGVNLPGVKLRVEALTEKDRLDLAFGLEQGVDYIALSFVRRAADVLAARKLVQKAGRDTPILAKLEKPEAIRNLEEILESSDGVMVARGDLGVEMDLERVPVAQKHIIERAAAHKKPVITATQMLESMIAHPRPTRAEASDVANAVFDGTDALMLSGETAVGRYPVEAVKMMDRIVRQAEAHPRPEFARQRRPAQGHSIPEAICESVAFAAQALKLRAIVVFTRSGASARYISKYRPGPPIYAFCDNERTERRVALYWGVQARRQRLAGDADSVIAAAVQALLAERKVKPGDLLAAVAGSPFGVPGSTNFLKLVQVH